jgi:hypothetical protein
MAMKKKRFDALAASRRWRRATSKLLGKMTEAEQIAFLNRSRPAGSDGVKRKASRPLAHR